MYSGVSSEHRKRSSLFIILPELRQTASGGSQGETAPFLFGHMPFGVVEQPPRHRQEKGCLSSDMYHM
jgi:hypothetical protein